MPEDFARQLVGILDFTSTESTQVPHTAGTGRSIVRGHKGIRGKNSKPAPIGAPLQSQIGQGSASNQQGAPNSLLPLPGSQNAHAIQMPQMGRYVHLLVSTESLQLSVLDTQSTCNGKFFQELKREYYRKKGWLSSWFGFKKFSHCEFHKVSLGL